MFYNFLVQKTSFIFSDIKKGIIFPIDRELNRQGIETGKKMGLKVFLHLQDLRILELDFFS